MIWPPNGKFVRVAVVTGSDASQESPTCSLSGTSSERAAPNDVVIVGDTIYLRATRDDEGPGRTYTVVATVTDQGRQQHDAAGHLSRPAPREAQPSLLTGTAGTDVIVSAVRDSALARSAPHGGRVDNSVMNLGRSSDNC